MNKKEFQSNLEIEKYENPMKDFIGEFLKSYKGKEKSKLKKFKGKKFSSKKEFLSVAKKVFSKGLSEYIKEEDIIQYSKKLENSIKSSGRKINSFLKEEFGKIDKEKLHKELSGNEISLEELFEGTYQEDEEKQQTSLFGINKIFSVHLKNQKNQYLTNEEYEELKNTYSLFLKSYKTSKEGNYIEKTIKILIEEMIYCSNYFGLDRSEFLTDCGVKINQLEDQTLIKKITQPQKKEFKKYVYKNFITKEINDSKSDKIKTEIVMKILIYKNNMRSFALLLYNKMNGIMQNTNIKLLISEKFEFQDFENLFVFELIKGIKGYREKLFNGHGHKTKVMSYIDRILRNLAGSMNQKIVLNQELFGLYAKQGEGEEGDQIVDYLGGFDTIKEDEIYLDFSKWGYLIRYINQDSTELLNKFIKNFHYIKNEDFGLSLILNLQGYYFFEKVLKNYDLHGKIINSYFDLIFLLKKYGNLTYEKIKKIFSEDTLKFGVLGMNGENYNSLILYEFSTIHIKELMKDKGSSEEIEKLSLKFKKDILGLIDFVYGSKSEKVKDIIQLKEIIGKRFYVSIRGFEKLFIDQVYEKILEDHNLNLIGKLVKSKNIVFGDIYNKEKEYSKYVQEKIQYILDIHNSKPGRKNDYIKLLHPQKKIYKQKFRLYLLELLQLGKKSTYECFENFENTIKNKLNYFDNCYRDIILDDYKENNEFDLNKINMLLKENSFIED